MSHLRNLVATSLLLGAGALAQYSATYTPSPSGLPDQTEAGQTGTNKCGTASSPTSECQNAYINSIDDFCLWAPPNGGGVAEAEAIEVTYCTKAGRGTRVFPPGTITGAHFVRTPSYVQVTGTLDGTKIGITAGDQGGELDPHGADGTGNPKGGLVFVNGQQAHEWSSFIGATEFCFRACFDGDRATSLCRHTYDVLGCGFNMPGNYDTGAFETCDGDDAQDIMYGYPGLSTFQQDDTSRGVAVPSPHPAPASYNCRATDAGALGGTATDFGAAAQQAASPTQTSSSSASSSSAASGSSSSSGATPAPAAAASASSAAAASAASASAASASAAMAASSSAAAAAAAASAASAAAAASSSSSTTSASATVVKVASVSGNVASDVRGSSNAAVAGLLGSSSSWAGVSGAGTAAVLVAGAAALVGAVAVL